LTPGLDDLYAQCVRLDATNHRITSRPTGDYNCVAWVQRDLGHWWEPDFYWPPGAPVPAGDEDLEDYVQLFEGLGFATCPDGELQEGYLKIAIYGEGRRFHHVAKQLPSGAWSSKAGPLHDLRHDDPHLLEDVGMWNGARIERFMSKPFDGVDPFELEEHGLVRP
jgi:hypothetical protein